MKKPFGNFGLYLREARIKSGLTQEELGSKTNVIGQFVSNWERGNCAPPEHAMGAVIKTLKLNKTTIKEVCLKDEESRLDNWLKSIR